MSRLRHWSALASVLCTSALVGAENELSLDRVTPVAPTEQIPIKDFFRPRLMHSPTINSTGTHVAAIVGGADDRQQLLVYDLTKQTGEVVGGRGDKDIYSIGWLNDRRLYFEISDRKLVSLGLFGTDVAAVSRIYPIIQYFGQRVISVPRADRLNPLVWLRFDQLDGGRDWGVASVNAKIATGLFVNLDSPRTESSDLAMVKEQNEKRINRHYPMPEGGLCYGYLTDKDGALAFAYISNEGDLSLQVLDGEVWRKSPLNLDDVDVIGPGNRPFELVVRGPRQEGKPRPVLFMNALTGEPGTVIYQDKTHDFDGSVLRHPLTGEVLGLSFDREGPALVWFDDAHRALQKAIEALFPGQVVRIIDSDETEKIFLIRTFSDRHPTSYHWVNLADKKAGLVRNTAPWIDPKRMRPTAIIKFKTRDGISLDAYLTLPEGASKTSLPPLIVLPHGGPWVRDTWGFDREVQFLASRGYAVLQPNYRGSTGYDWRIPENDRWDYLKMHQDVTDAAKKMKASGLIDPDRIGIMGASFGGYLALFGATDEPGLYHCAVTVAGVFDWEQLMKQEKHYQFNTPSYHYMIRKLGDPAKEKDRYEAISPLRRAHQIKIPMFVSHGSDDFVVDVSQSRRLVSALEKGNVPHEKFFASGEGHGMQHLKNSVELYSRIETFLAKNLQPGTFRTVAATPPPAADAK